MEESHNYQLILNHLIEGESHYDGYSQDVGGFDRLANLFLSKKYKYLTEDDIVLKFGKDKTLEEIFSLNKDRFVSGSNIKKGNETIKTWYYIKEVEPINVNDNFFDYFFVLKLRHIALLEVDNYLYYHLEKNYRNDRQEFLRFLNIAVRTHEENLLNEKILTTIQEWITLSEKTNKGNGTFKESLTKRTKGDNVTSLTLTQTALLIEFMQESRMILKEPDLGNTQVGEVFNILTGYSPHTLRQHLGQKGVERTKNEDYIELYESIHQLAGLIESKIHKK